MSWDTKKALLSRLLHGVWLPIASCCAAFVAIAFYFSTDVYADSCRTLIYRADTAGYDSQYVQICPTGNGIDVSTSRTLTEILGINVKEQSMSPNDVLVENKDGVRSQLFRFVSNNCPDDYECSGSFSDFTTIVLNNASDRVGDSVANSSTGEKVTYSYNGIYDGSYSDWENAGYPDENGNTYDENSTTDNTEETSSENSDSDPCYDNSTSVGWLVCPVITWFGDALGTLYDDVITPFLQIESSLVDTDPDGTYGAWSAFRDIANIIFVILVIIVILSQVTGLGISNYGIKKALPKIIVVAILVNLSYVLCQLAIDISNIIGFSVEGFLSGLANNIGSTNSLSGSSGSTSGGASYAFAAVVGVVAAGAAFATGGAALIITTLLSLFSALISLLFMFIILGVRKAGIVLLVALAPLAIVCYALPNTEKLAKRWLGIFKTLLFVYPIAGILIGGCNLAAQIILKATSGNTVQDTILEIIGMLLFVVPFFMLPSLLKKSIAGADQIFGSIVNKGEGLTGAARGKVQNSELMKRNQARLASNRQNFSLRSGAQALKDGKGIRGTWSTMTGNRKMAAKADREKRRAAQLAYGASAETEAVEAIAKGYEARGLDANQLSDIYQRAESGKANDVVAAKAAASIMGQTHSGRNKLQGAHQSISNTSSRQELNTFLSKDKNVSAKAPAIYDEAGSEFLTTMKDSRGNTIKDQQGNDLKVAKLSASDLSQLDVESLQYIAKDDNLKEKYQKIAARAIDNQNAVERLGEDKYRVLQSITENKNTP